MPRKTTMERKQRTKRQRIVRRILAVVGVLVLIAGGVGYWALDRYVIDHVQISDVEAYEAQVRASTTIAAVTLASVDDSADGASPVESVAPTTTTLAAPIVSTTSYVSNAMSISISTVIVGEGDDRITYFVADAALADASSLHGGFAENKFGTNIVANTSTIAKYYDAVFAINGDYYGFRDSGIVIRNGVLFRDKGARVGLAMYTDGSMKVYNEKTTTGERLLSEGVRNTVSFGPALVDAGAILPGIETVEIDTNLFNHSIQGNQPRAGIGLIEKGHVVFVVVDGRSPGYSRGVTMTEFAQIFVDLGATVAYNLDGGGSATMWFNGAVVNNPLGKGRERGISDILYLVEPDSP